MIGKGIAARGLPASRGIIGTITLAAAAVLATLAIGFVFTAWRTVEPGFVGIVFDKANHRVTNTLDPGWTIINPLTQSITKYPISVQTLIMVRADREGQIGGDDSVKVGTREGQTMNLDVGVQYSVSRDEAARLYQTWAGAPITLIEDNLVRQVTRAALNDVASQYGWEEIYGAQRIAYTQKVSAMIQERLADKFVKFEALNLRGWHVPPNLQQALEQKITAQQAAEQQTFALQQAGIKARQDQVQAEGEANALRAQARGEADATRIRAQAQSEANTRLAESLTPELIRYEQLQRWNGKLPVFSGSGGSSFIDVEAIAGGAAR